MKLIAIQLNIAWEDRSANHALIRGMLDGMDDLSDSLIVLPEMFDVGFSMNTSATDPGEVSTSEKFCRELADEKQATVLAGIVARAEGESLANEAVAFSPAAKELVRYRKMQPFSPAGEDQHYIPGATHKLFELQGIKIAPFICYDLRFPEIFRRAAREGAELFIVIANWPSKRSEHWVALLKARAIENQAYVLGVNRTGNDPALKYDGRTCLFDPLGREIFQADDRQQLIRARIDPQEVRRWRRDFGALRDMKYL